MNKFVFRNDIDLIDGPAYDEQYDLDVDQAVRDVMKELEQVSKTSLWARGGIFQLYMLSDKTLEQVATDTGISKSTVLLSVKRIKEHLTARIKRPIRRTEEELL